MVKTPVFFTSPVAISARLAMTLAAMAFFSSHFVARASARAPLLMAAAAFIAFMGAIVGMKCEVRTLSKCPKI